MSFTMVVMMSNLTNIILSSYRYHLIHTIVYGHSMTWWG